MIERADDAPALVLDAEGGHEGPPSWDRLRADGCMLIDDALQKLAVYAGNAGSVVLTDESEGVDGEDVPKPHYIVLDPEIIPALIAVLTKAQTAAQARWAEIMAEVKQYEAGASTAKASD